MCNRLQSNPPLPPYFNRSRSITHQILLPGFNFPPPLVFRFIWDPLTRQSQGNSWNSTPHTPKTVSTVPIFLCLSSKEHANRALLFWDLMQPLTWKTVYSHSSVACIPSRFLDYPTLADRLCGLLERISAASLQRVERFRIAAAAAMWVSSLHWP